MTVSAETLRKLATLGLSTEQMAGVLSLLADQAEADEQRRAKQAERKRRSREKNETVTGQGYDGERDGDDKERSPTPPKEITTSLTLVPSSKPSEGSKPVTIARATSSLDEAVSAWNQLAEEIGLAKVTKLNAERRPKLKKRLAECGGIDGWHAALAKVRDSPFLTGGGRDGWRADFDFLLQAKSFTRLTEGAYDDRGKRNGFAGNLDRAAAVLGEQDRREGICGEGWEEAIRLLP